MRVLDVVDGVLARLLLGELDVEVDVHVGAAAGEEPAGGVGADLGQELVEGDERAGALRHRDLDAVPDEADPAGEDHLDRGHVVAHRLGGVPDPGHRPVVVRAPDVDEVVEAAAELLGHVADVRGEVGRLAVGADDHAVLVVPERRGPEPEGAVLLVQVAPRPRRRSTARPTQPSAWRLPSVFQTSKWTPSASSDASIPARIRSEAQRPAAWPQAPRPARRRPGAAPRGVPARGPRRSPRDSRPPARAPRRGRRRPTPRGGPPGPRSR